MGSKKPGLGRGLNALLVGARATLNASAETSVQAKADFSATSEAQPGNGLMELALDNLRPGQYQPRRKMQPEELEHLADSIRTQGILQPLVVRRLKDSQYEIIAGERRFRAAGLAGLTTVPVIVKQVSDENALSIALIENIQRENLNALEEAIALERLTKEFKYSHIQIAEALGKSRTAITNSLRLLSLTDEVKLLLEQGDIEVGHAKVLLGLRGQEQNEIARQVVARDLSVRETERLIAKRAENEEEHFPKHHAINPDVKRLQENLSEKLGAKVEIQQSQQGKGKLVIQYNSLEELEGILDHIQ